MKNAVNQRLGNKGRRRNKAFDETHAELIDIAVRLISQKGMNALSLTEVAREAGVNRTTVYYHFDSREALIDAVREWSSRQITTAFASVNSSVERIRYLARFVLEKPEVIAMWTEDFLAPGDIAERYPAWAGLVEGIGARLRGKPETAGIDPDVYGTLLLTWAMIGPRVYCNSVCPDLPIDEAVERITRSQLRMLQLHGVVPG
ncbi:TetR family transcriptional regulator [Novosphingobium endophyticum]|uniref:TetR family transcriptional regulator n=1 Tax=Novosphingobium endophyticum TaxID=1955250 RepID=A0A916TWD7_9SPHN|nr:TetR/AcrR family transcriptional regulator [Novosphingobium endophyticum]GGC15069.1 TetR family transcriptional regulator [Novosphingobium endophyticum]